MRATAPTTQSYYVKPLRHARAPRFQWVLKPQNDSAAETLSSKLAVPPLLGRILYARGYRDYETTREFLEPPLRALRDPFAMQDMASAADRIARAIRDRQNITIYGDYDADGATATALLLRLFRFLGHEANFHIPLRLKDGYGLHESAIESLAAQGTKLLITVDTGITGIDAVARARELGVDVIITDHHQPGPVLPKAVAVVNPNRVDCPSGYGELAGVGVAFKLAHAVLKTMNRSPADAKAFLSSNMDLVAFGTIADFAPLQGENRILVRHGLRVLANTSNTGFQELKRLVQVTDQNWVPPWKVGFQLAPRINAAGRTSDAGVCAELLITSDRNRAAAISQSLDHMNRDRQRVEQSILNDCLTKLEELFDETQDAVAVVHGEGWHVGVVGIVASRLVERIDRPAIVLSCQDGVAKGSARSIPGFNIHAALTSCKEHIMQFGGHPAAAGLTLAESQIAALRAGLNAYARQSVAAETFIPRLEVDSVARISELTEHFAESLMQLEPCGAENPQPVLMLESLQLSGQPRVVGTQHLRLRLRDLSGKRTQDAIGFNQAHLLPLLSNIGNRPIDLVAVPKPSTYSQDSDPVELHIRDIRVRTES